MQEANESNPTYLADAPAGSWATSLRAGVVRAVEAARARLRLSAEGAVNRYHDLPSLNEVSWSAGAAGELRASPRTRVTFTEAVTSTYAREMQEFNDAAAVPPSTVVLRGAGTVEVARRLTSRATLSAWARHEHVGFESPLLRDGGEWGLGSRATLGLGPRQELALALSSRRSHLTDEARTFIVSSLGWKGALGRHFSADATAGLSYGHFEPAQRSFEPEGRATLALKLRRTAFAASYSRLVGEAFGYGRQRRADVAAGSAEWRPSPRWRAAAGSSYGSSREIAASGLDVRTRTHSAEVSWMPLRQLTVGTGYTYLRRNPAPDVPPVVSHAWRIALSVSHDSP